MCRDLGWDAKFVGQGEGLSWNVELAVWGSSNRFKRSTQVQHGLNSVSEVGFWNARCSWFDDLGAGSWEAVTEGVWSGFGWWMRQLKFCALLARPRMILHLT